MKFFSAHVRILFVMGFAFYALFGSVPVTFAQQASETAGSPSALSTTLYDTGSSALTNIWVDAVNGNDANDGASPASALRTLTQAWNQVPMNTTLSQGIRINLQPGNYTEAMIPNYWEARHGTFAAPVFIRGNGAARTQVVLQGTVNMYDSHYIYFENLSIIFNGDNFHCELCDHILLRNVTFNGGAQIAQETVKINQSQYIYIENNDISGAWDNAIDFVAVQYGHIVNNRIHNAGDWCAYTKGGSAYLSVEANVIYDCGTGGFTAGQGTGFQFMTSPWIQYEAYDIKVINNVIHDTAGAGLGVNGGYNILMAYNTMYRVGSRDHVLEVVFGSRSCDGQPGDPGRERCGQYLTAGGWGTTVVDDGTNEINIPNKNVFIYNNVVYNPAGFQSQWTHFAIYDPRSNPNNASNAGPNPARTDENLQIRGNIIWNGSTAMPLGIEDNTSACANSNPTCNQAQLLADNKINTIQPQFTNPTAENFHPAGTWITGVTPVIIPNFTWDISGVPTGNDNNAVISDFENADRSVGNLPGAYITAHATTAISFNSIAEQDGWILESTETSNKGGTFNGSGSVFNLGDNAADRQYRSVLSFDTGATLPDDAIVTSATLKIRRNSIVGGGNPLTALHGFRADIRGGSFGAATLANSDFQASANISLGPFTPALVSQWYTLDLSAAAASINTLSLTQIRLRFSRGDNDNHAANYIKFYSGNAATASYRPTLYIEYYMP